MGNKSSFNQNDLASRFYMHFNIDGGKVYYALSGVFITNLKGQDQNWLNEQITLTIPIDITSIESALHIEQWVPFFTMNSVYNQDEAVNSGHAVDSFDITGLEADENFGQTTVSFLVNTAVRDSDAYLYRIGYNVALTGTLKPTRPYGGL
jgi:hypothetical protein